MKLEDIIPLLKEISQRIDESVDNPGERELLSDVVELMGAIYDDNWMFVRN